MPEWEDRIAERMTINKLYSVMLEVPQQDISKRVRAYLRNAVSSNYEYDFLLTDWWSWDESVELIDPTLRERSMFGENRVEYVGKPTKRLSKALKLKYGIELPSKSLSAIGQIVESWRSGVGNYQFDLVKKITWNAGDFGDQGTCYWSTNALAKHMLVDDPNFYAIRFYDPDPGSLRAYGSGRGIGRAWVLLRTAQNAEPRDGVLYPYVFNGYWYADGDSRANHDYGRDTDCTRLAAKVLAKHLDAEAHLVTARNFGACDSTLYINAGRAYAILPADANTKAVDKVDFLIEKNVQPCGHCNKIIHKRTETFARDPRYRPDEADAPIYCVDCFDKVFCDCQECGNRMFRYDGFTVRENDDDVHICANCYKQNYYDCLRCQRSFHNERYPRLRMDRNSDAGYCPDCVAAIRDYCLDCGELHHDRGQRVMTSYLHDQIAASNRIAPDDMLWQFYCERCAMEPNPLDTCDACGCLVANRRHLTHDHTTNRFLCDACLRVGSTEPYIVRRFLAGERTFCTECYRAYFARAARQRDANGRAFGHLCGACYQARITAVQPLLTEQAELAETYANQPTTYLRDANGRFVSPRLWYWAGTQSATEASGAVYYILADDTANTNGVTYA